MGFNPISNKKLKNEIAERIGVYLKEISKNTIINFNNNLLHSITISYSFNIKGGFLLENYVRADKLLNLEQTLDYMKTFDIDCDLNFDIYDTQLTNKKKISKDDIINEINRLIIKYDIEKRLYELLKSQLIFDENIPHLEISYIIAFIMSKKLLVEKDFLNETSIKNLKKIFRWEKTQNDKGSIIFKLYFIIKDSKGKEIKIHMIDLMINIEAKSLLEYLKSNSPEIINNNNVEFQKIIDVMGNDPDIRLLINAEEKYNKGEFIYTKKPLYIKYSFGLNKYVNLENFYKMCLKLSYLGYGHNNNNNKFNQIIPNISKYWKYEKNQKRLETILKSLQNNEIEPICRILGDKDKSSKLENDFLLNSNFFLDKNDNKLIEIIPVNKIDETSRYMIQMNKIIDKSLFDEISNEIYDNLKDKMCKLKNYKNPIYLYSANCSNFSRKLIKYYTSLDKKILNENAMSIGNDKFIKDDVFNSIKDKINFYSDNKIDVQTYFNILLHAYKSLEELDIQNLPGYQKLPDEFIVYRGMNNKTYNDDMTTVFPKNIEDMKKGDIIYSDLFLSTSISFPIANSFNKGVIFEITIKNKDKVIFMGNKYLTKYLNEKEILLPAGSKLEVNEIKYYRKWQIPTRDANFIYGKPHDMPTDYTKLILVKCNYIAPDLNQVMRKLEKVGIKKNITNHTNHTNQLTKIEINSNNSSNSNRNTNRNRERNRRIEKNYTKKNNSNGNTNIKPNYTIKNNKNKNNSQSKTSKNYNTNMSGGNNENTYIMPMVSIGYGIHNNIDEEYEVAKILKENVVKKTEFEKKNKNIKNNNPKKSNELRYLEDLIKYNSQIKFECDVSVKDMSEGDMIDMYEFLIDEKAIFPEVSYLNKKEIKKFLESVGANNQIVPMNKQMQHIENVNVVYKKSKKKRQVAGSRNRQTKKQQN